MRRVALYIAARFCAAMARRWARRFNAAGHGNDPDRFLDAFARFERWAGRATKFSSRIGGGA